VREIDPARGEVVVEVDARVGDRPVLGGTITVVI